MCIRDRYKTIRVYTTLVAVYSPEDGCRDDSKEYYRILQIVINNIHMNDYVIIARDFNGCVGNSPISVSYTHLDVYKRQGVNKRKNDLVLRNNLKLAYEMSEGSYIRRWNFNENLIYWL